MINQLKVLFLSKEISRFKKENNSEINSINIMKKLHCNITQLTHTAVNDILDRKLAKPKLCPIYKKI